MIVCLWKRKFPDSMTAIWDAGHISDVLTSVFVVSDTQQPPAPAPAPATTTTTTTTIDVLITFDRHGVSSHPNHRSLYHGARHFLGSSHVVGGGRGRGSISLYTLTSTAWIRKYASVLDSILTMFQLLVFREKVVDDPPTPLLLISSTTQFRRAQSAMTMAHKSQMRWFRWGWIVLSRYMIVNDLKLEKMD